MKTIVKTIITFIGFMLSPLSWWNDAIINLPLAYLFTLPFGKEYFLPAFITGYWITNIIGLMMMSVWVEINWKNTLLISIAYTLIISLLVIKGIIVFPEELLRLIE